MHEKSLRIRYRDLAQCRRDSRLQGVTGAGGRPPQIRFDLGEGQFNRRIVGRVGRQIHQSTATGGHNRLGPGAGVGAEVIGNDDLAEAQGGGQDPCQIGCKRHPIAATHHDHGGSHAGRRDRSNRGRIDRGVAWDGGDRPCAHRGPRMGRGHVQITANFVNDDQLRGIEIGLLHGKRGARPWIAFGGDYRLFFRDQPSRRMARAIVHELSVVP